MARLGAKKNHLNQIVFGIGILLLIGAGLYLAFGPSSAPPVPQMEVEATPTATDALATENQIPDAEGTPQMTPAQGATLPSESGTPLPPEVAALQTPLPEATATPNTNATPTSSPMPTESVSPSPTGEVPRAEIGLGTPAPSPMGTSLGAPFATATPRGF